MSSLGSLAQTPIWVLFLATSLFSVAAVQCGWWLGRRAHRSGAAKEPQEGASSVTFGLLAFILAFTFGVAASRSDERRIAVVDEANAIRTAYLRASFLSEPQCTEVRGLLRRYVDLRLTWPHPGGLEGLVGESEEVHAALWDAAEAFAAVRADEAMALFVGSVNELIDVHGVRANLALRARVPSTIWLALYVVTALGMASLGYNAGVTGPKRTATGPVLILSFAIVTTLIVDLDRPREGLLRPDQGAMISLQRALAEDRL